MKLILQIACAFILFCTLDAATLIAVKCSDGIVLISDTLSTLSPQRVGSRIARRIFLLQPGTAVCNAADGAGAGQFFQIYNALRDASGEHQMLYESPLGAYSLAYAASRFARVKYPQSHFIVAGADSVAVFRLQSKIKKALSRSNREMSSSSTDIDNGGGSPHQLQVSEAGWQKWQQECSDCFRIFEVLPGGTVLEQNTVVAGTGSTLIAAFVEEQLKKLSKQRDSNDVDGSSGNNFSVKEAMHEIQEALRAATKLDPRTGGDSFHIWTLRWSPLQCMRSSDGCRWIAEADASGSGDTVSHPSWLISRPSPILNKRK